jgi:uncharacterized protein (DUF2249 family)
MSTPIKIESADDVALSAIVDHHAQLRGELESRLAALRQAVTDDSTDSAHARLVEFVDGHLLPHAAAEEMSLYPAAARNQRAALFVESMLLEHRDLERKAQLLRYATSPAAALSSAEAIAAVFAIHVVKENDLLLPVLSSDPSLHLSELLAAMHEQLGEGTSQVEREPSRAAAEELDARTIAHGARHEVIFSKLHALAAGESLFIVNDHDPKPLRYQLDAAWPGVFEWSYVLAGPQVWRIEITKVG